MTSKFYTVPSATEWTRGVALYGAAAMLLTTANDYAKFLLAFLEPQPADAFRPTEFSRQEMFGFVIAFSTEGVRPSAFPGVPPHRTPTCRRCGMRCGNHLG